MINPIRIFGYRFYADGDWHEFQFEFCELGVVAYKVSSRLDTPGYVMLNGVPYFIELVDFNSVRVGDAICSGPVYLVHDLLLQIECQAFPLLSEDELKFYPGSESNRLVCELGCLHTDLCDLFVHSKKASISKLIRINGGMDEIVTMMPPYTLSVQYTVVDLYFEKMALCLARFAKWLDVRLQGQSEIIFNSHDEEGWRSFRD